MNKIYPDPIPLLPLVHITCSPTPISSLIITQETDLLGLLKNP